MRGGVAEWVGALALAAGCAGPAMAAERAGEELMSGLREELMWLPAADGSLLQTTVFRPAGDGPFPLLIMSHGKALGDPRAQPRDRFAALAREFVARGYAVASPMRRGFAGSGGAYEEKPCDTEANARRQAQDIEWALKSLSAQPWARADQVALAGQSYGGIASIAAGSMGLPGARGVINFAGGLKDSQCDWREAARVAFKRFGAGALPSLWLYGANDSLFGPEEARAWSRAHNEGGGKAELIAYGAFKSDAHGLAASVEGARVWAEPVDRFLASVGLPSGRVSELASFYGGEGAPAGEAAERFEAGSGARRAYEAFLSLPYPRAFASSKEGRWSWASDGDDPAGRALAACQEGGGSCELDALDGVALARSTRGRWARAKARSGAGSAGALGAGGGRFERANLRGQDLAGEGAGEGVERVGAVDGVPRQLQEGQRSAVAINDDAVLAAGDRALGEQGVWGAGLGEQDAPGPVALERQDKPGVPAVKPKPERSAQGVGVAGCGKGVGHGGLQG